MERSKDYAKYDKEIGTFLEKNKNMPVHEQLIEMLDIACKYDFSVEKKLKKKCSKKVNK